MRTLLFAAVAALGTTNFAVAQDDNAITDMISNPILWVSQRTSYHLCATQRHRWRVLSVVRRGRYKRQPLEGVWVVAVVDGSSGRRRRLVERPAEAAEHRAVELVVHGVQRRLLFSHPLRHVCVNTSTVRDAVSLCDAASL